MRKNMEDSLIYFENLFEQARQIGKTREKIATVKRLKEMEFSIEQIAKGSGLTVEEVQKILNTIAK